MYEECLDLSICIPTNGVIEWVLPVLDSIYEEKQIVGSFEVIVTDNGNNTGFEAEMLTYTQRYENIIYKKTEAVLFLNQIEAFKLARGRLIKFLNHRMKLKKGALNYLIDYSKKNSDEKSITYFLNGSLPLEKECNVYHSFDEYVRNLSYWSSWSAGTAMWKTDFERMDLGHSFNNLFPHTNLIFFEKNSSMYIINNKRLFDDIPVDTTKKGNYDVFNAFAVEYVKIIESLLLAGYISESTYRYVKNQNLKFVTSLYFDYVIRKQPCSYEIGGYKKAIDIYYNESMINKRIIILYIRFLLKKIKHT